jgi:hypothetical protein
MVHDLRNTGVVADWRTFTGESRLYALTLIVPDPAQKGKISGVRSVVLSSGLRKVSMAGPLEAVFSTAPSGKQRL